MQIVNFYAFRDFMFGICSVAFQFKFQFRVGEKKPWARSQGKTHKHKLITQFKGALRAASKR